MKGRLFGLLMAALVPLSACGDGETEEVEDAEVGAEIDAAPAVETPAGNTVFRSRDADADQRLDRDEWAVWYADQGIHDTWNADASEGLTGRELAGGAIVLWDGDGDETLTESEWSEGMDLWFTGEEYGDWNEWDDNEDGVLDTDEVAAGIEDRGLHARADRDGDGLITDDELAEWWFDLSDSNDDGAIDADQWDQASTRFLRADGSPNASSGG